MKTLEWLNFFSEQRRFHGKVIFSVAELANAAHTTLHAVNTELGRLLAKGVLARYAQGRYGPAHDVGAEDVVQAMDAGAYITGFYALSRHNLVTQLPTLVTCFTNHRHNRQTSRSTPAGRLKFVCVPRAVYSKPAEAALAGPEQALCDFVWLNTRDGVDPQSLVSFQHLDRLNRRKLVKQLRRYPAAVQDAISRITR
ncbi:MAG: hypothetical protein C5B50_11425 [Verrucomicrobia bacterium]|nr:MAG: hypothetical protein C5B50_11425 [Verrucomicrobiota bacterium]